MAIRAQEILFLTVPARPNFGVTESDSPATRRSLPEKTPALQSCHLVAGITSRAEPIHASRLDLSSQVGKAPGIRQNARPKKHDAEAFTRTKALLDQRILHESVYGGSCKVSGGNFSLKKLRRHQKEKLTRTLSQERFDLGSVPTLY